MDIETRYTLERGISGFYTYAEYTHPASYPPAGEGENRFILEIDEPTFDWLSVDKDRNMLMSANAPAGPRHSRQGAEHLSTAASIRTPSSTSTATTP